MRKALAIFEVHGRTLFLSKNSLFFLKDTNPARKVMVWLTEWRYDQCVFNSNLFSWFKYFITLCIMINSICLAIYDYRDRDSLTKFNKILEIFNLTFTCVFLGECFLKILAMGFVIGQHTYMRDPWNIVDLCIAITG